MRVESIMASALDLGWLSNLECFLEVVLLALLAAMFYSGLCFCRRAKSAWALVFTWSALASLILHGALFLGQALPGGMRSVVPARETLAEGPRAESWIFLHEFGELLAGASILFAGIALIYLGRQAGRVARP